MVSDAQGLFFVGTLGTMLAAYLLVVSRETLSKLARHAAFWAVVFLGTTFGLLWPRLETGSLPKQAIFTADHRVETERAYDGHYYLTLSLNGTPVDFVIDTGATSVVLTHEDAVRVGMDLDALDFSGRATTANGVVRSAKVKVNEVALGPIRDLGMDVWINRGEMQHSLLGMSYLSRFERIEISSGTLSLER